MEDDGPQSAFPDSAAASSSSSPAAGSGQVVIMGQAMNVWAIAASADRLASEWHAAIGMATEAVEARELAEEEIRASMTDPHQPIAPWLNSAGWACLNRHARTNSSISAIQSL